MDYSEGTEFIQMEEAILGLSAFTVLAALVGCVVVRSTFPFMLITLSALCYLVSSALVVAAARMDSFNDVVGRAIGFNFFETIFPALAWCIAFGALRPKRLDSNHPRWHVWNGYSHGIHLAYLWTLVIIILAIVIAAGESKGSISYARLSHMYQFCTYGLWAYPVFLAIQWGGLSRRYDLPGHRLFIHGLGVFVLLMLIVTIGRTVVLALQFSTDSYKINFAMAELFGIFALWWAICMGRYWTHKYHQRDGVRQATKA
ncbi:hypothetical protein BCR43DRAFT_506400 [Syncephalastrum racemosum]|uniref:Uncharacterized protein n=1 Tax=Syncephalastrum racemosum TaxID=13706 RepID=A0A1X2H8E9_SYNRA|nr:hypothetical protein BCR43DRAFT_506400 [Syncephalastrum racemosum]